MSGSDVVESYFRALDAGDAEAIPQLFTSDCRVHRPELPEPLVGTEAMKIVVTMAHRIFERFETAILDILEDGDAVAVRVRHDAMYRREWRTRVGTFDVSGKPTSWEAMALFRVRDGRIAEERVFRDELGMLLEVGAIEPAG